MVMVGRIGRKSALESAAAAAHMLLIEHMVFELMVALMAEQMVELMADLMADLMVVELAVSDLKAELSSFRTAIW